MPAEVPAGRYVVTLVNQTESATHVVFLRLPEGKTAADFHASIDPQSPGPPPGFAQGGTDWVYGAYMAGGLAAYGFGQRVPGDHRPAARCLRGHVPLAGAAPHADGDRGTGDAGDADPAAQRRRVCRVRQPRSGVRLPGDRSPGCRPPGDRDPQRHGAPAALHARPLPQPGHPRAGHGRLSGGVPAGRLRRGRCRPAPPSGWRSISSQGTTSSPALSPTPRQDSPTPGLKLSNEAGFNPRACRYWESRGDDLPTSVPQSLARIEQVLLRHGVEVFTAPTPGCRLASSK